MVMLEKRMNQTSKWDIFASDNVMWMVGHIWYPPVDGAAGKGCVWIPHFDRLPAVRANTLDLMKKPFLRFFPLGI